LNNPDVASAIFEHCSKASRIIRQSLILPTAQTAVSHNPETSITRWQKFAYLRRGQPLCTLCVPRDEADAVESQQS
jgi:hypothetical protein